MVLISAEFTIFNPQSPTPAPTGSPGPSPSPPPPAANPLLPVQLGTNQRISGVETFYSHYWPAYGSNNAKALVRYPGTGGTVDPSLVGQPIERVLEIYNAEGTLIKVDRDPITARANDNLPFNTNVTAANSQDTVPAPQVRMTYYFTTTNGTVISPKLTIPQINENQWSMTRVPALDNHVNIVYMHYTLLGDGVTYQLEVTFTYKVAAAHVGKNLRGRVEVRRAGESAIAKTSLSSEFSATSTGVVIIRTGMSDGVAGGNNPPEIDVLVYLVDAAAPTTAITETNDPLNASREGLSRGGEFP